MRDFQPACVLMQIQSSLFQQQLSVKEFYLKIIPWRLFTFRVCPGTKVSGSEKSLQDVTSAFFYLTGSPLPSQFTYCGPDPIHKYLTLVVDDGIQPPVELSCKDRNIMAATFIRFLHKNIGWSTSSAVTRTPFCLCVTRGCNRCAMLSTGGSETFQDKVNFFQRELRHIHSKKPRTKTCLKITRHFILDSVSAPSFSAPVVEKLASHADSRAAS